MKKIRTVLIVLSALYVLLTIIFLLNDESLFNNFNMLKLIDYLQAWMVVGLVLLTSVIIAGSLYIRSLKSHYNKLEKEHNVVKGQVYEIEEERKAEIARQKAEEEDTERKLEAFNQSIKGKHGSAASLRQDPERPGHARPGHARPGHARPDFPESETGEPGPNDDKPVQP